MLEALLRRCYQQDQIVYKNQTVDPGAGAPNCDTLSDFTVTVYPSGTQIFGYWAKFAILSAVAYLGYGRHGSCHGRHFNGGAKIAWPKFRFVTYSFFNYFSPHTTINCKAASTQCLYLMHMLRQHHQAF